MTDARVLLALAALVVLTLVYVSAGVQSALAPLCAAATTALWFAAMGCLGWLWAGGWAYYLLCALGAGWLVWRHILKKCLLPRLGFGFWFFVAASLCAVLLLWVRQPMFSGWDEFSFWGTADKVVKLYDELYTTAPVGWGWPATQSPALPVFGYFTQFFGGGFSEWQAYAGRDIFQLAALSALLAPFARRHWDAALPAALLGILAPFALSQYHTAVQPSAAWMDTLADFPLGLWFFAALAAWYASPRRWRDMLPVCLALATLTLIKETGLAFALVAAAVMLFDALFEKRAAGVTRPRHATRAAGRFALAAGASVAAYQAWTLYLTSALGIDRAANVGGARQLSLLQMPLAFVQDLFASERSARFDDMLSGLWRVFANDKVTAFGTGLLTVCVILAVVALAAVLARNPVHRRRCVVFGVLGTLGFAVYRLFIGISYVYVFRAEQLFADDRRYMMPYYLGWFLAAVLMLCTSVGRAAPQLPGRARWRVVLAKAGLLGLCAAVLLRLSLLLPAGYTVAGVNRAEFGHRRVFASRQTAKAFW